MRNDRALAMLSLKKENLKISEKLAQLTKIAITVEEETPPVRDRVKKQDYCFMDVGMREASNS